MSAEDRLLAIDVGTGSCRAVLFDLDGQQLAIGQREYSHRELPGAPGSQVFDTDANWELICACTREALDGVAPDAICAVSATSMREGMVLYDARGREIWACPNVDARAGPEATELVGSGVADEIYERAGDWVSITAPARFRWLARHEPDLFASIAHVGMLGDWVLTRLTGEFATDPSLGSSSGMFDLAQRDWSEHVLGLCELDRSVFPQVLEPGTIVGRVTAAAAQDTGLREGTPVAVGGADTQLSLLGIGVTEPGRLTVVGGSFWQCTAVVDTPLIDPRRRLRTLCHTSPGRWMIEGIGFYSGLVMRWFRDAFCELEALGVRQTGEDVYDVMERKAMAVPPGANGIFGIFSNVMQTDRWVHASPAFIGLDIANPARSGRAECFRAIEESAAYVTRAHLEIIAELTGVAAQEAVLTGGAAKGALWAQIVADTLGVPIRVPVVKESTALGAAICAGVGAGIEKDPAGMAQRLVTFERTVEPAAPAVAAYDELYDEWRALYAGALELSETGLTRPLWRAAGT